jgi:hypothetical protein
MGASVTNEAAPADIIIGRPDRPSSIVAPTQNLRTTIPLKRGDVNQQPMRRPGGSSRLEQVGLRQSSLESALVSRARVWGQRIW